MIMCMICHAPNVRRTSPMRYDGGVCLSEDGGKTWRPSSEGMPPIAATHIVLDPASPADARFFYVTGWAEGFSNP